MKNPLTAVLLAIAMTATLSAATGLEPKAPAAALIQETVAERDASSVDAWVTPGPPLCEQFCITCAKRWVNECGALPGIILYCGPHPEVTGWCFCQILCILPADEVLRFTEEGSPAPILGGIDARTP